jgi:hypothetical protein
MTRISDVDQTFLSRLFYWLRDSPNVIALKNIVSDVMQDTVDVSEFILSHNSIDYAEGEQLEILGELIGVPRPFLQEDEDNLFTLSRLGEWDDPDNSQGFEEIEDLGGGDYLYLGGFLVTQRGLNSITHPGEKISDVDYRRLIRQKAASYRKKMTRYNLFNYLYTFGSRCTIDDETAMKVVISPVTYYDLNEWEKWYVMTRGFKPAGIQVIFSENLVDGDST